MGEPRCSCLDTDAQLTAGKTYVYEIRALDANGGSASPYSNRDLATLMTFASVVPLSTTVSYSHWQQLLDALNAVRRANGDPAVSWASILPAGIPVPAVHGTIEKEHLESLRVSFTSALQALGVASPAYTNPNLTTEPAIRAVHVTELQQRAK